LASRSSALARGDVVEQLGERAELVAASDGYAMREIAAGYRFSPGNDPLERLLDEADRHRRRKRQGDQQKRTARQQDRPRHRNGVVGGRAQSCEPRALRLHER
jgi:hypothetical protein